MVLLGIGKDNVYTLSGLALGLLGGLGVVIGWWAGGGPWLGGLSLVGSTTLYLAVWRVQRALPPLEVAACSFVFLMHLALACWPSVSVFF